MVDNLDFAPALMLALLRTITLVTGKPPIKPAIDFQHLAQTVPGWYW